MRRLDDGSMQALTGIANGCEPVLCNALICDKYRWYSRINCRRSAFVDSLKVGGCGMAGAFQTCARPYPASLPISVSSGRGVSCASREAGTSSVGAAAGWT